jgi:putative FmdB family regulatory protein
MPIYAYRCSACGHSKDVLQKMSDPVLSVCPVCGKSTFEKQVTAAGFQLKGSGWYVTDFRGGPKPAGESGNKEGAPADAASQPAANGDSANAESKKSDATKADAKKAESAPAPAASAAPTPAAPSGDSK